MARFLVGILFLGLLSAARDARADVPMVVIHLRLGGAFPYRADKLLMERTDLAVQRLFGPEMKLKPAPDGPDLTTYGYPVLETEERQAIYRQLSTYWGDRIRILERPSAQMMSALPPRLGTPINKEALARVFSTNPTQIDWDGANYREMLSDAPRMPQWVRLKLARGQLTTDDVRNRYWSQRQIYDEVRRAQGEGVGARIDARVVTALLWHESAGGDTKAVGPATAWGHARGIAQFIWATGRQYGLKTLADFFDPRKSIRASLQHLEHLYDKFQGKVPLMLAAYNAGEYRKSLQAGFIPQIHQTINYVKTILGDVNSRIADAASRIQYAQYMPDSVNRWLARGGQQPAKAKPRPKKYEYKLANGLLVDLSDNAS